MLINIWVLNFYIFFKSSTPLAEPEFQIHTYDIEADYDEMGGVDYTGEVTISTQNTALKNKTVHLVIESKNESNDMDPLLIHNVYMTNGVGTFEIWEYCDIQEGICNKPYLEWRIIGWRVLDTWSLILEEEENDEKLDIPSFLLPLYKKIEIRGNRATIQHCIKWRENIYVLTSSTGYTGETNYYTDKGKLIGTFRSSDTPEMEYFKEGNLEGTRPVKNDPPVKLEEYTCSVLKKSS